MSVDMSLGETQLILSECQRRGLLRNQAAYVLATAFWESARTMEPVKEAFWLSEAWRKNNLRYYPWYGRGFVQITWEANYVTMGNRLNMDLTSDPEVVMDPALSAQILVVGMVEGLFTSKKLSDYITLKQSNYRGARRIVNGTDKAGPIAEIAEEYEDALLRVGYGIEAKVPVANERRDGTQPRSSPAKSKTLWAQVQQWLATNGVGTWAFFQAQDEQTRMLIGAALVVSFLAGVIIFRDRLRAWAEGWR